MDFLSNILAATDGSESAALATKAAANLAAMTNARLHVVHAWRASDRGSGYPSAAWMEHAHMEEREARRTLASHVDLAESAGGIECESHLLRGSPTDAILDLSDELAPDLLVVGRRGLGAVRGIPVGSVAERVAHHARCPVLVMPKEAGSWPPVRVICGDDCSEVARKSTELSVGIGGLFGAGVVLARAYENPPTPTGGWSPKDLRRLDEGRARLEKGLTRRAEGVERASGRRPETRLIEGDATLALLLVAGEERNTLLSVGGRGADSTGRARLGGVPANLLKAAGCPVLVYPCPPNRRS